MAWTRSACPCLKPRGQQLTKNGKKETCKHSSLLFRSYKHQKVIRHNKLPVENQGRMLSSMSSILIDIVLTLRLKVADTFFSEGCKVADKSMLYLNLSSRGFN